MNQNQVPSLGHLVLVCFGKTFKYTTDPWLSKWPICVKMMPIFADICSIPDNMPEQTCNLSHASQAVLVKKNWAVVKLSRIDGKNTFFCVISTYHARVFTKKTKQKWVGTWEDYCTKADILFTIDETNILHSQFLPFTGFFAGKIEKLNLAGVKHLTISTSGTELD